MIRSLSFDNILNKKYEYIPFSKDFMDAFGKRQKSGAWIVYGKSGQGKTSFTFQLAREFDRIGYKVLFISLEMGVESDFRDSLLGFMNSSRSGMLFWDEVPTFDEFDEFLGKQRSPDVVIIDSLQSLEGEMDVTAKQLVELRKKYRKKIFVYISHVEGKEVQGTVAYRVKRDCFSRIEVNGFCARYMSRGVPGPKGISCVAGKDRDERRGPSGEVTNHLTAIAMNKTIELPAVLLPRSGAYTASDGNSGWTRMNTGILSGSSSSGGRTTMLAELCKSEAARLIGTPLNLNGRKDPGETGETGTGQGHLRRVNGHRFSQQELPQRQSRGG